MTTTHFDTGMDTTNLRPMNGNDYSSSPLPQRKKLQLKPRTIPLDDEPLLNTNPNTGRRSSRVKSLSSKGNPFGDAVPREQVLKQRGIDPAAIDFRIEQKMSHHTYSARQEEELEELQRELTRLEEQQRDANEKELPEERIRAAVDAKREELHALMDSFNKRNDEHGPHKATTTATGSAIHHNRSSANAAEGYRQQRA